MSHRRAMLLVGLLVVVMSSAQMLIGQPARVFACTCYGGPTLAEWIKLADAIFSGTVLSVQQIGELTEEWRQKTGLYPYRKVVIEVREVWKGIRDKRVTLHTGIGGGDCGVDFEVGRAYLVFAAASPPMIKQGTGIALSTYICQPTGLLSESKQTLQLLGKGRVVR